MAPGRAEATRTAPGPSISMSATEAPAAAKRSAQVNNVRNVRFVNESAETALPRMAVEGYDTVIFDPPRKGLEPSMIDVLCVAPVKRIIYVSCNPETLARDAKALSPAWRLVSLQGVDMFPHTQHVENVALLLRHGTGD